MSRLTLRARLTLVYGVLFLLAGTVLVLAVYVLVYRQVPPYVVISLQSSASGRAQPSYSVVGGSGVRPGEPLDRVDTSGLALQAHYSLMSSLVHRGLAVLLCVAVVSIAAGWFIAGRALRPLHRVTETARRIGRSPAPDGLKQRIALDGPRDEVKELADTFDTMLRRLDESFESQRRFVANVSHELRTPLTLNRALIEVAVRRKAASRDVKELGAALLDVNTRHERLINGLLTLARSQIEPAERTAADLARIVEHTVAQARAEAQAADVVVHVDASAALALGDPMLLERLVQNLVLNGLRHNVARGGWLRVEVRPVRPGTVGITVSNTGDVIAPEEIAPLFEPFRHRDDDRTDPARGAGLGLSIVQSVLRVHGGTVRGEPRDGGGLVVRVELPEASSRTSS